MANKKSRGRKKSSSKKKSTREVTPKREMPNGFWPQVVAVLMIALSILLVVTWFNKSGTVLQNIHQFGFRLMGYSIYLLPVILTYISVMIFKSENNRLSPSIWISAILMLFWCSGIFGVPTFNHANPTGGIIGESLNMMFVQMTTTGITVFIYIVLIFITALFMYGKTPATVFKSLASLFKNDEKEDAKNAKIVKKGEQSDFALTNGASVNDDIRNLKVLL